MNYRDYRFPIAEGYWFVPFCEDYGIAKNGDIFQYSSKKHPAVWKSTKNEKAMVCLTTPTGRKTFSIAYLIASTFIPVPLV